MTTPSPAPVRFSIVRGDPLFRLQRALKLVSDDNLFPLRRAILFALVAWLPIAVWAIFLGDDTARHGSESFLRHFGVQVRCLITLPLLIIAEGPAERLLGNVVAQFVAGGLVGEPERERFDRVLRSSERLRDAWPVWLLLAVLLVVGAVVGVSHARDTHELAWGVRGDGRLGFGAWWFFLVARPLIALMNLVWLWRTLVIVRLFRRLAKLDLRLIPAHPDRAGGLGFVEQAIPAFSLVVLAISAGISGYYAHLVLQHGLDVASLKMQAIALLLLLLVLFLSPLFMFGRVLLLYRRRAYLDYSAFIGRVDAEFDRHWVRDPKASIADALDVSHWGSLADASTVFATASRIRGMPISKSSVLAILIPALVPMVIVALIQIPLKEILTRIASAML